VEENVNSIFAYAHSYSDFVLMIPSRCSSVIECWLSFREVVV